MRVSPHWARCVLLGQIAEVGTHLTKFSSVRMFGQINPIWWFGMKEQLFLDNIRPSPSENLVWLTIRIFFN